MTDRRGRRRRHKRHKARREMRRWREHLTFVDRYWAPIEQAIGAFREFTEEGREVELSKVLASIPTWSML